MNGPRHIDPAQAGFWDCLDARLLEAGEIEPCGVEYVREPKRLREIRRQYPCPTVVDAGHGVFGSAVGLVFVDDDTGRAIAYAAPLIVMRTALDDRSETTRILRDGLIMIEAIARDGKSGHGATVGRMCDAAVETLRRAGCVGLDADGVGISHSQRQAEVDHSSSPGTGRR